MASIGAHIEEQGRGAFCVWAPDRASVTLRLSGRVARDVAMQRTDRGYWTASADGIEHGTRYTYVLDGSLSRPDPASHHQPDGVHGPSAVVDHGRHAWSDAQWQGVRLKDMILYELHTGTFTPEGTFDAIISRLDDLGALGINAIELMPVAQFPGERNWGYDGVYPYAAQHSYGGPDGLKRLVDEAHRRGIAVVLDVVYNHLGPEGNYLADFGPYFTDRYRTPWGPAVNFDGPMSDEVRAFFFENALHWFAAYHVDALRLDAVHGIYDFSAQPFLMELSVLVDELSRRLGRHLYVMAESDLNDSRLVRPREQGGFGLHAQWSDDVHHGVHTLLTGERNGYYVDFGKPHQLAAALTNNFVYAGGYSRYRKRRHGNDAADVATKRFVAFSQNHDQVGNRMLGERLFSLVPFEGLKLAASAIVLSPFVPLIFMGEEYGESNPFQYFVSHGDVQLVKAVRKGRAREFAGFGWHRKPPDPQDPRTFERSRLSWERRGAGEHKVLLDLYGYLIGMRRQMGVYGSDDIDVKTSASEDGAITAVMMSDAGKVMLVMNFSRADQTVKVANAPGTWKKAFDSAEMRWHGAGALTPASFADRSRLALRALSAVLYEFKER